MTDDHGGWLALAPFYPFPAEVIPINDLRPHAEGSPDCWCRPTMQDGVLVHNSMDGREAYEQGRKPQ